LGYFVAAFKCNFYLGVLEEFCDFSDLWGYVCDCRPLDVAFESPISGTMAEIFIQLLEDSHIKHLLDSKGITFYSKYVDDIFIIYDSSYTIPNAILQYANTIHNNVQINPTPETWDRSIF
jgi:hypothetical protein